MLDKVGNTINEGDTLQVDGRGTYVVHKLDGKLYISNSEIVPFVSENSTVIKTAVKSVVEPPKAESAPKPLPSGAPKSTNFFNKSEKKK